jgi:putative ABC transport system permease protein
MWQDIRFGARMRRRVVAIGVGANSAMFSVADGLIFRPLSVPDARSLVTVSGRAPDGQVQAGTISTLDYTDLLDRARTFDGLLAATGLEAGIGYAPPLVRRG